MNNKPSNNPYEAPETSGESNLPDQSVPHWLTGSFPINIISCLFGNIVILVTANSMLKLLGELGIELPIFSRYAYSLAHQWIWFSACLLIFAGMTIYAKPRGTAENRRQTFNYMAVAYVIWISFTVAFGFAILYPLFSIDYIT